MPMTADAQVLSRIGGSVLKQFFDGTHRAATPEETLARVRPFMAAMGITRVADVTGLDSIGIPVVMVSRPNSRSLAVSQGKGLSLAAAKASGVMEAVESYHAERIALPLKLGSYADLESTHRIADVARLPFALNSPYRPELPLLWIEGWDLIGQEPMWVPFELVHTNYTTLPLPGAGCFSATSNGLASGNNLLEAISHGICEVVERDATVLWRLLDDDGERATRLDLATVDDSACCEVLERYDRAGVAVGVWEITSDTGISAFACEITERAADPLRPLFAGAGMGCHPAREIALLRALTEAAQSRLTSLAGSRDDMFRSEYERSRSLDNLAHHRRRILDAHGPLRCFKQSPTFEGGSFDADVSWELELLQAIGIERVIVVDLTRPEFNLPVVRVVIPGLEGSDGVRGDFVPGERALRVVRS